MILVAGLDQARDSQKTACRVCAAPVSSPGLDVCNGHIPDELGITYRQLDYWSRRGHLHPGRADPARPWSGSARTWTPAELEVARLMGLLTAAGLTPGAAERVARAGGCCEIAPGIRVELLTAAH
jgi:hypothetical protein